MIVELFLDLLVALLEGVAGLLGDLDPPGFLTDAPAAVTQLVAGGASLGAWIPWSTANTVVQAVFASAVIGFGIKLVRLVVSYLTAGGGSAG